MPPKIDPVSFFFLKPQIKGMSAKKRVNLKKKKKKLAFETTGSF